MAAVSKRSVLKQTIKTMNAAGVLAPEEGHLGTWKTKYGCGSGGRRVRTVSTGKENSVSWMQDRLVVMGVMMGSFTQENRWWVWFISCIYEDVSGCGFIFSLQYDGTR